MLLSYPVGMSVSTKSHHKSRIKKHSRNSARIWGYESDEVTLYPMNWTYKNFSVCLESESTNQVEKFMRRTTFNKKTNLFQESY